MHYRYTITRHNQTVAQGTVYTRKSESELIASLRRFWSGCGVAVAAI